MSSFADLGVSSAVVDALNAEGIRSPFAVQNLVIADILAGRDVLARSPTGSGKTLAFGIPLVDRIAAESARPAALILAPTRELATQIAADIRGIAHSRALSVTAVYGGVGLVKQAKQAARSHILVATPGRLEDLLARRAFSLDAIQTLILDEADRMLDMGFRPAVDRVVRACPQNRQTLFFSATLDGEAGQVASRYTTDAVRHEHGPTARRAAADVEHRFVAVNGETRLSTLINELGADRDLALVFVRTKHGADRLVKRLGREGVDAVVMHGNRSQRQREVALSRFEAGTVDTLVATDVAARGIDIAGISHVINFDVPADHETYVHRVGRTGRAGRSGVGITFVEDHERRDLSKLADTLGIPHDLGTGHGSSSRPSGDGGRPARQRSSGRQNQGTRAGQPPRNGQSSGRGPKAHDQGGHSRSEHGEHSEHGRPPRRRRRRNPEGPAGSQRPRRPARD